jgi:NAD/NADP octopine/nopaline dehydrogenase, alpha-helical domain
VLSLLLCCVLLCTDKEGVTKHIAQVLEKVDSERIAIGKALFGPDEDIQSLLEWMIEEYGNPSQTMSATTVPDITVTTSESHTNTPGPCDHAVTLYEFFNSNPAYDTLLSPMSIENLRYFTEDIPFGLMGFLELAAELKVDVPAMKSVCTLVCVMFENNWTRQARTVESLGMAHLSRAELIQYATFGTMSPQSDFVSDSDSPGPNPRPAAAAASDPVME